MNTVWSKADLHVHTTHGDGHAGAEEVLEHAVRHNDLRAIAIADHDTTEGVLSGRWLRDRGRGRRRGLVTGSVAAWIAVCMGPAVLLGFAHHKRLEGWLLRRASDQPQDGSGRWDG